MTSLQLSSFSVFVVKILLLLMLHNLMCFGSMWKYPSSHNLSHKQMNNKITIYYWSIEQTFVGRENVTQYLQFTDNDVKETELRGKSLKCRFYLLNSKKSITQRHWRKATSHLAFTSKGVRWKTTRVKKNVSAQVKNFLICHTGESYINCNILLYVVFLRNETVQEFCH